MKWYHSIKAKLLGLFLLLCLFFLTALIITFFRLEKNQFRNNALKETSLATQDVLKYIHKKEVTAEVIVSSLSSIYENILEDTLLTKKLIPSILNAPLYKDMNLQSAGIWFEAYSLDISHKNSMIFFDKNKENTFYTADTYKEPNNVNYRDMPFYKLGKTLKDNEIIWTNVYTDPVTKVRMVTVVSPIYHQNKFMGVASLDLGIDEQDEKLSSAVHRKDMYLMIVDNKGTLIGKTSILTPYIKTRNIYDVDNKSMKVLIDTLRPALIKHTQIKKNNEITKDIFIIEEDPILEEKTILSTYHLPSSNWHIIIGIKEAQVMAEYNKIFKNILLLIIVLTLLSTIIGYYILQSVFVKPIEAISKQLQDDLKEDNPQHKLLSCNDRGEIGTLVNNLNDRSKSLDIAKSNEAKEIQKRLKNEKLLIQQSKMAAMGEMMDAVAHQWKQPLNALSMYSEIIKSDFDDGSIDAEYIHRFRDDIQMQIDHMVNTLDEFRTFFRPNKENHRFLLSDVIHSVLFLTKDDLLKHRITVSIEKNDPLYIEGSENELKHLVLNIINNAKDAFNDNGIEKRKIIIRIIQDKHNNKLEIEDNAGGIPDNIIDDIFKANVTSKEEGKGTGIGLYMSTQIATKHHATLSVKNKNEGACFTVQFDT